MFLHSRLAEQAREQAKAQAEFAERGIGPMIETALLRALNNYFRHG